MSPVPVWSRRPLALAVLIPFVASVTAPPSALAQRRPRAPTAGEPAGGEANGQSAAGQGAPTGGANRPTGYELELHGTLSAPAGRPLALRGTAFEVLGLATLRPLPRARVVLYELRDGRRTGQTLADVRADASGRFDLAFQPASGNFELEVGGTGTGALPARVFTFTAQVQSPYRLELLTDRRLYEPGETLHAWARLTDLASGAPIADRSLEFTVNAGARPTPRLAQHRITTGPSGVAAFDLALPAASPDGPLSVAAQVRDAWATRVETYAAIGRRTVERLFAEARVDQQIVAPGGRVTGAVTVRTPSGAPVRGARVEVRADPRVAPVLAETDAQGRAAFALTAPAYAPAAIATQTLDVRVVHRAHGTIRTAASYTLARVPYSIEAVAGAGALVPETSSPLYVTLADPRGAPPAAGTPVRVAGPGVAGGAFRGTTDRHGVVAVPMRVPRGDAARHDGGACGGAYATSFDVTVDAAVPLSARLCARVAVGALVAPRVASAVVEPGARVEVAVERRPAVRARPVVVELLHRGEGAGLPTVLASQTLAPAETRAAIALPAGYLGPVFARARPVLARGAAEGTGASDVLLVRPAHAFALAVAPERPVYRVRETARLLVRAPAGLTDGYVALVARDLAAHGGEQPFALAWLRGAVTSAVADPSTPEADRLVRAALAAYAAQDPAAVRAPPLVPRAGASGAGGADDDAAAAASAGDDGEGATGTYSAGAATARGDLRDPFALRDELLRRGVGVPIRAIEQAVDRAIDAGQQRGVIAPGARAFDPALVRTLLERGELSTYAAATLGGGEMTLAMLQAAVPEFTFERLALRLARRRLVRLLAALGAFADPPEGARSPAADEPPPRWLSRMVQRGLVDAAALRDPWGGAFALRQVGVGREAVAVSPQAPGWELASPGPDGAPGTGDDVRNPFARAVPAGSVYAVVAGEDELLRQLAALDPGAEVLARMAQAYRRIGRGAAEESEGEAAGAGDSEATATTTPARPPAGTTAGDFGVAGGGAGRGSGADAAAQLAPAAPAARASERQTLHRHGAAEQPAAADQTTRAPAARPSAGPRVAQLAALVRERFPATLRVLAVRPLDPSGTTALELPLADALTTYRIDAIAWTRAGWTSSASADVRVDQDAVVDAPVPPFALVGDLVRLPVRVSNRSTHPIRARVGVASEGAGLHLEAAPAGGGGGGDTVAIEPGDAREVLVAVRPRAPGRGTLVLTAVDAASGAPLDAARRPLTVLPDARPVRMYAEALVDGHATLTLEVPRDALARADGVVRVTAGAALFGDPRAWGEESADPSWPAWALAASDAPLSQSLLARVAAPLLREYPPDASPPALERYGLDPAALARTIGALWSAGADAVSDDALAAALTALTASTERYDRGATWSLPERAAQAARDADALLGLGPALRLERRRPAALARTLRAVAARLRRTVEQDTAVGAAGGDTTAGSYAQAAAALALGAAPGTAVPSPRAAEYLRRAARSLTRVGDELYLEPSAADDAGGDDVTGPRVVPSAQYALAVLAAGDRATAFAIARTLARAARRAARFGPAPRALCAALAAQITAVARLAPDARARVVLDGRATLVPLVDGVATLPAAALSSPGRHRVEVTLPAGVPLIAQAEARYGRPWTAAAEPRGPLVLTLDGATGVRDARAALVLRVQNRGPRVVPRALIELDLPAGAELDQDTRAEIRRRVAQPPVVAGRTLALTLRALAPGGSVRIPLGLRWSVGGALRGLGIAAYASDEVGAGVTVVSSRLVQVPDGGDEPRPAGPDESDPARQRTAAAAAATTRAARGGRDEVSR